MRDSIHEAIGSTVTDMMNAGLKVSFTKKELDKLGVEIPKSKLNVSTSSIRQWEQGQRKPSGSTIILLELLQKNPDLLNYRLK